MFDQELDVYLEYTPNPNTLKYTVNRILVERGASNFTRLEDAEKKSPLALRLFGIAGITGVMIGKDFVTITKEEDGDWEQVHKACTTAIKTHLSEKLPVFTGEYLEQAAQVGSTDIEKRIIEIIDQEIRPAVAQDGGDIVFDRYDNGVVYLEMRGACSGCPSSTMTLKMGIEKRLMQALPQITEVVSI